MAALMRLYEAACVKIPEFGVKNLAPPSWQRCISVSAVCQAFHDKTQYRWTEQFPLLPISQICVPMALALSKVKDRPIALLHKLKFNFAMLWTDNCCHLTDNCCHLTDNNCHLTDNNCHLTDNSCHLTDNNCHLTDNSCHLTDNSCP